jgi:hypothetical protein
MLNFLPALILLLVQGSSGADLSPRQLHLLATLAHSAPSRASLEEPEAGEVIRKLLRSPGGKQILASRGSFGLWQWAISAMLGEPTSTATSTPIDSVQAVPRIPDPPQERLSDGHDSNARTRDGPF